MISISGYICLFLIKKKKKKRERKKKKEKKRKKKKEREKKRKREKKKRKSVFLMYCLLSSQLLVFSYNKNGYIEK